MKQTLPGTWWDRSFLWLWWSLFTIAGWAIGWTLGAPTAILARQIFVNPQQDTVVGTLAITVSWALFGVIFGAAVGLIAGLAQWFVVRHYVSGSWWWIVATTVGMAIGMMIGWPLRWTIFWMVLEVGGATTFENMHGSMSGTTGKLFSGSVGGIASGVIVGMMQWLFLRQHFSKAYWWIVATTASISLGMALGWAVEKTTMSDLEWTVSGAIGGVFYSGITGIVLAWLMEKKLVSS